MSAPRLSPKEKDAILALYIAGTPTKQIAAVFGVSPTYPTILAKRRKAALRKPQSVDA